MSQHYQIINRNNMDLSDGNEMFKDKLNNIIEITLSHCHL